MNLLSKIIGEDIHVRVLPAPDLSVTAADPTQIEQVLMNLCLDARDAMSGIGDLVIETQNVELNSTQSSAASTASTGREAMCRCR